MSLIFRTQYSPSLIDIDMIDDGDEVEGYLPGMAENPGVLLERLEAGAMVGVRLPDENYGQGNYDDFFDVADRVQDMLTDPVEHREPDGGTVDLENPSVEKKSSKEMKNIPSTPPATPPADTES